MMGLLEAIGWAPKERIEKYWSKSDLEMKSTMQIIYEYIIESFLNNLPPIPMCNDTAKNPNTCGVPAGNGVPLDRSMPRRYYSFSEALNMLKDGVAMARGGWNGRNMYLRVQRPDAMSFMTNPYIYITTGCTRTINGKDRTPWLASQTDLLSEDWYIVSPE